MSRRLRNSKKGSGVRTTTSSLAVVLVGTPFSLLRLLILLWMVVESAAAGGRTTPSSFSSQPPSVYPVDEHFFDAVVDHYSFRHPRTFPLRYFVSERHWRSGHNNQRKNSDDGENNINATTASSSSSFSAATTKPAHPRALDDGQPQQGPVFFYAGNEANVLQFVNHSGFLFEAAREFGALVVFAEHRYYGSSVPDRDDLSFLTVEQAMADFNALAVHLRQQWRLSPRTALVAWGGSYGGNLALWLRLKNPNIWAGAIAASATPLKHLLRDTNGFARIETQVYGNVSSACPDFVRRGWRELYEHAATASGRLEIADALDLCSGSPVRAKSIHGWVSEALETLVQYGYPYETEFYNPVPAYPFAVACRRMLDTNTGLGALRAAVDVYYNYTGQAGECYQYDLVEQEATRHWKRKGRHDHESSSIRRAVRSGEGNLSVEEAWGYQLCTEVYQPMPTDGVTDFEVPFIPNKTAYYERCWKHYGVHPRPEWEELTFMGANIFSGSNIFLSSGQLDPWRAAGIQSKPRGAPDSIVVRTIENGAHHLDLRASHPADPPSVVAVRREEKAAMRAWIEEWSENPPV